MTIIKFTDKIYPEPSKRNYIIKKTDVLYFHETWNSGFLDLFSYGPAKKEVTDMFFLWLINLSNLFGLFF